MGQQHAARDRQPARSGVLRKKPWQPKGGRPRLRVAGSDGKPRRVSVEQAVKGLRRLQLQALKDLRLALRNARQFEIRKVCRRQRSQEERCKTAKAGNADEAVSLQKCLAKLGTQLQALKILSVSSVLPLAVVRAGLPPALLQDGRDKADPVVEVPPAGGAEAQPWAVERVLAAHVVQQAIQKIQLEQRKQEQAVRVAQSRKEKRQEARQAREDQREQPEEEARGGPRDSAGQARSERHAAGPESSGEEDEEAWREDATRALRRLQSRSRAGAQEEATTSGDSSREADSASEGEMGQQAKQEGGTWAAAGGMEEGSISGSESDGEASGSGDEGQLAAEPRRGATKQKAGPRKGKKNRLGQRERRRLVAAGMPQAGHRGASSKLPGRPGRGPSAQAQKQRRPAPGQGPGTRMRPSGTLRTHSPSAKRVTAHVPAASTQGLHPSWAAKRAQAGALKQTGSQKKVVFDEEGRPKAAVGPSYGQNGSRDVGSQKPAGGGGPAPLHPSWAAKRAQAEKTALIASPAAAKKIKFDD